MIPRRDRRLGCSSRFVLGISVILASGCTSQPLRIAARRTAGTLPDLQYQQVIDNLAATAANPDSLPYLAIVGAGTIQVTDNGSSSLGLSWTPGRPSPQIIGIGASRAVTGTWSLGTITSPEKLRSMRTLYQTAVAGSLRGEPALIWLKIGRKNDVPKQACYVASHGRVFVWVMPEGVGGLSELTLEIMDIGTREDAVEVSAPGKAGQPAAPRTHAMPRRNFQVHPLGPVYTPGAK
jgi:hypothetical protein